MVTENPSSDQPITPPEAPRARNSWTSWDVAVFMLTLGGFVIGFFLLQLVALGAVTLVSFRGESADAMRALAGALFANLAFIGLAAAVVRFVYGRRFFEEMRWRRRYEATNASLVVRGAGLAFLAMVVGVLFPPSSSPPIERLLNTPQAVMAFAIFGVGMAPFLEEMIFRGILFRVLEEIGGSSITVRTTALLFALLHVPQLLGSYAGMLMIFAVGYVLSDLRERTGSMIPPLIVHTAYNGLLFLAFALSTLVQETV